MSIQTLRELEIDLYGDMIMEEQKGITRRKFIGGALAGAVSIITPGFIKNAFAGSSLPPGIAISTQAIKTSWHFLQDKNYAAVESYMGLSAKKYQDYSFDINNEPKNEPATYLILAMISRTRGAYGNLPESDPMMLWASGIGGYVSHYIMHKGEKYDAQQMQEKIETPFLSAIFKCAGRSSSDVRGYFLMSDTQKEQFLSGVMNNLESAPKREQLIAAWGSFFLTRHFEKIEGSGKNTMLYYNQLEQKTKKILGSPIRGPPHYGFNL